MNSLKHVKCYILDMDGTIYLGSEVLPGAKELLHFFDEHGISYFFFTNNSSKSPAAYTQKLGALGFGSFGRDRIITSADVTAKYIKEAFGDDASVYLVGTPSLKEQFEAQGIRCLEKGLPSCVVVGFDTTYSFEKAARATDLLLQGVPFLATNVDAVCPLEGGKVLPDCASMCAMLTHATGKKPKFLGKPSQETAAYIRQKAGVEPREIAVVGDRLYTDMHLAIDNGMCSVGVLSGEMTKEDIENSPDKPDYILSGVDELLTNLRRIYK